MDLRQNGALDSAELAKDLSLDRFFLYWSSVTRHIRRRHKTIPNDL